MRIRLGWTLLALTALGFGGLGAQDLPPEEPLEARVWMDRGDEPLLQRGDRVRLYYRTSSDAYVAIFHIDTDGAVRLLHPRSPDEDHFVRAARDYRLLFPQSSYWYVDEYPGKGYFFMLASPVPFDFSQFEYVRYDRGWDLTRVGRSVYEDPYLAIDEYVASLIPDWEAVPYGLDFIAYDVGEHHDYPRFLCYDCHGFRSYATWNPYTYVCATYRVVIWDDPYFYPAYRYSGTRVVYAQPRRGVARFGFKERAIGEPWSPLVRTRQPPPRRPAQYVEPTVATPRAQYVPPRRPQVVSPSTGEGTARRATPSGRGGVRAPDRPGTTAAPTGGSSLRRPSGSGAVVTPPGATRRPSSGTAGARVAPPPNQRPTLQRRPSATGGSGSARPSSGVRRSAPAPSRTPTRAAVPSRPSTSRPGATQVRPSPSRSGASGRPPAARPSTGSRPAVKAKPPPKRPTRPPPRRKPGG